jgi:hypothetical protein
MCLLFDFALLQDGREQISFDAAELKYYLRAKNTVPQHRPDTVTKEKV